MARHRLTVKFLLLLGFLFVGVLFLASRTLRRDWSDFVGAVDVGFSNLSYRFWPERRPPITLAERQIALVAYMPEPFEKFTADDWNDFWSLIYGVYPLDDTGNDRLPKRVRNLDAEEVKQELVVRYPFPFQHFQEEHWKYFWQIVLKGRITG
jgi:hypothetical protein